MGLTTPRAAQSPDLHARPGGRARNTPAVPSPIMRADTTANDIGLNGETLHNCFHSRCAAASRQSIAYASRRSPRRRTMPTTSWKLAPRAHRLSRRMVGWPVRAAVERADIEPIGRHRTAQPRLAIAGPTDVTDGEYITPLMIVLRSAISRNRSGLWPVRKPRPAGSKLYRAVQTSTNCDARLLFGQVRRGMIKVRQWDS
jgi:hypothetical protein